jgi:hypothetical protein
MSPKDYQPSQEPNRTPDKAEGSEEVVQAALQAKGLSTGDGNEEAAKHGQCGARVEPSRTPGRAEG